MARKDITMTPAELLLFLGEERILQVATIGPDGWPHLVPMWYVLEGERVVFRSFTRSQKITNLQRDPRLTVVVERGDAYAELQGVMIKGRARLEGDPGYVLDLYGRMAAKYPMIGDAPVVLSPDVLEATFGRYAAKNTAVIVEPEHIVSWDHTKLGGAY